VEDRIYWQVGRLVNIDMRATCINAYLPVLQEEDAIKEMSIEAPLLAALAPLTIRVLYMTVQCASEAVRDSKPHGLIVQRDLVTLAALTAEDH
tara:strand:- start:37 stop:315 length:279 start_codon:yes stop_codon:yes gene_type:complete